MENGKQISIREALKPMLDNVHDLGEKLRANKLRIFNLKRARKMEKK
jgi:hypothetical protein